MTNIKMITLENFLKLFIKGTQVCVFNSQQEKIAQITNEVGYILKDAEGHWRRIEKGAFFGMLGYWGYKVKRVELDTTPDANCEKKEYLKVYIL